MYRKYLWYVLRHKWYVFVECCKLGIPWLGIVHDLSKFLPSEFAPYARYFYGDYPTGHTGSKRRTREQVKASFDMAWLYHQNRNRHHWQYWILRPVCLPMPDRYRREMLADLRGGEAQGRDTVQKFYGEHKHEIKLHPDTRSWLEGEL